MANQLSTKSVTKALLDHPYTEHCEHILAATACAVAVLCEDDSFGPLTRYAVCKACHDKAKAEHNAQLVTCCDCKQHKPRSDVRQWRWFDFYAPQGDEPLDVCKACWDEPKHQSRLAQDRMDAQAERDYDHDYDYSY